LKLSWKGKLTESAGIMFTRNRMTLAFVVHFVPSMEMITQTLVQVSHIYKLSLVPLHSPKGLFFK